MLKEELMLRLMLPFFQHACCHSGVKTYNSRMHLALSSTRQQACRAGLQLNFACNSPNTNRKKTSHWAEHAKPPGGGEISRQLRCVVFVKKAKFIKVRKLKARKLKVNGLDFETCNH